MKFQSTTELSEERTFPKTDISAFFFFWRGGEQVHDISLPTLFCYTTWKVIFTSRVLC